MAADAHFTQISNALFRDTRLSFRDKGVFGLISTHRDGFGVTAESIAACSPTEGVSAIKASLRNLESLGYLSRTRTRNSNGTLGVSVYYITDQPMTPQGQEPAELPSSEPVAPQPPVAEPLVAEPTVAAPPVAQPAVADRLHKNTNSKHIKLEEDSLSSDPSEPTTPEPPAAGERESEAAPGKATAAQRAVRASGVVSATEEQAFIAWVCGKYPPAGAPFWNRVAENGDIPGLVVAWRADQPMRQAGPQPRVTVHDTSGRDRECRNCDRPIKPDTPEGLCRDCREVPSQSAS